MKISFTVSKEELAQDIEDMKLFLAELVKAKVITVNDLLALAKVYDGAAELVNTHEHVEVNDHLSVSINGDGKKIVIDYFVDQQAVHAMNMVTVKMAGKLARIAIAVKGLLEAIVDLKDLKSEVTVLWNKYFNKEAEEAKETEEDGLDENKEVFEGLA